MPDIVDVVEFAPRSSAGAIKEVLALYSPRPGETRSYAERRTAALEAVMGQVRSSGVQYQAHVMEALNVSSLLDRGLIQRPAPEPTALVADGAAAKSRYVQAIREDARLAARLMRRCGEANPPTDGETLDDHFKRVAEWDFDRGFDNCEYPHLQAAAVSAISEDDGEAPDGDGLVDEARVSRENMALISQALELAYRSEENFFGWNQGNGGVAQALGGPEEESIDPRALLMALDGRANHSADGGQTVDDTDASQPVERPRGA